MDSDVLWLGLFVLLVAGLFGALVLLSRRSGTPDPTLPRADADAAWQDAAVHEQSSRH